jgi:hypothetical protein
MAYEIYQTTVWALHLREVEDPEDPEKEWDGRDLHLASQSSAYSPNKGSLDVTLTILFYHIVITFKH